MSAAIEFWVRARHLDVHHAWRLFEPSFEAAAVAYAEHHPLGAEDEPVVSIIVRDAAHGQERCYRIDLSSGAIAPCGPGAS